VPGAGGQLLSFMDIYQIDVWTTCSTISTLTPVLQGVHIKDSSVCIPHDIAIGQKNPMTDNSM